MGKEPESTTRKSVSLPDSMWAEIAEFRFEQRIGTEAEAIRRLLQAALVAEKRKAALPGFIKARDRARAWKEEQDAKRKR